MRPIHLTYLLLGALACGTSTPTGSEKSDPVTITTTSLPSAVEGNVYGAELAATGGDGSFMWTVTSGALPGGLVLGPNGGFSGAPTETGSFSFTVEASSDGESDTRAFSLDVHPALEISTSSLPGGTVSSPYSELLVATGGDGDFTWSLVTGSLPEGLALGTSSGEVAGTPTAEGSESFTVQVESGDGQAVSQILSIVVTSGLVVLQPGEYCSDNSPAAIGSFESSPLESAVRARLGISGSELLSCETLAGVVELEATNLGIANIAGIQNLTGLTYLRLDENFAITDINWLSGLTLLNEELDLSENAITDVSALSGMINLLDLNLATNSISDVSGLSGLIALIDLNLNVNPVADVSPLAGLPSLQRLQLWGATAADFSSLAAVETLTSLEVRSSALTHVDGFGGISSLEVVNLSGNALSDIGGLQALSNLRWVSLTDNVTLSDIQPLLDNTGIGSGDYIYLNGTAVSCADVAALEATGAAVWSDCG